MQGSHHIRLAFTGLIAFLILTLNVQAAPILSTNTQYFDSGTLISDDSKSGSSTPISSHTSTTYADGSSVYFSGPAYASATSASGRGAVRADGVFWGGQNPGELRATSTFGETVTNSSGSVQNYFYDFSIAGPLLEIDDYVTGPIATISYSIEILLDGSSIWSSSASLVGGKGPSGFSLTQSGTNLGATFFCNDGGGCNQSNPGSSFGYEFGSFSDQLMLGAFADGDSFTLETILEVSVSAPGAEMGGLALIGDPSSIGTDPGITGTISTSAVPIPAAFWLLGSGLMTLLVAARRKSV